MEYMDLYNACSTRANKGLLLTENKMTKKA